LHSSFRPEGFCLRCTVSENYLFFLVIIIPIAHVMRPEGKAPQRYDVHVIMFFCSRTPGLSPLHEVTKKDITFVHHGPGILKNEHVSSSKLSRIVQSFVIRWKKKEKTKVAFSVRLVFGTQL
jgi:hypothetical protein